jgi:hypothetical protein
MLCLALGEAFPEVEEGSMQTLAVLAAVIHSDAVLREAVVVLVVVHQWSAAAPGLSVAVERLMHPVIDGMARWIGLAVEDRRRTASAAMGMNGETGIDQTAVVPEDHSVLPWCCSHATTQPIELIL